MSSFVPMNIEESFIEPDGFYSKINEGSKKKLILIQLPKDFSLKTLNNCKIEQNQIIKEGLVIHSFQEISGSPPASLALPGKKGFIMNNEIFGNSFYSIKDPIPSSGISNTSNKKILPFEKVIDSAIRGREQPKSMKRPALNALDFKSLIKKKNK